MDVTSAKTHVLVHSWMIETQVLTESGSMAVFSLEIANQVVLRCK